MENDELKNNEWQGKRKNQIEYSEAISMYSVIAAIATITVLVILKLIS